MQFLSKQQFFPINYDSVKYQKYCNGFYNLTRKCDQLFVENGGGASLNHRLRDAVAFGMYNYDHSEHSDSDWQITP